MKKKVLCALLATCMVASMTACGSKSSEGDTQAAADGSISLRVWAAEEDQDLTNELVEKFKEANPDQTFDIQVGVESEANAKDDILVDPESVVTEGGSAVGGGEGSSWVLSASRTCWGSGSGAPNSLRRFCSCGSSSISQLS